jgi:hypothetical protein
VNPVPKLEEEEEERSNSRMRAAAHELVTTLFGHE